MNVETAQSGFSPRPGGLESPGEETGIVIRDLAKSYPGNRDFAVRDFNVDVKLGELVVLLGASGCGKTTVLRSIAGLERIDGGEIRIGGEVVSAPTQGVFAPPERRGLGMVFQSYAIWPHMKVKNNVAYPLRCRKWKRHEADAEVESALSKVGLAGMAERYPSQLSGGQQQRVALARALIARPTAMLFDEPLSNLDAKLRAQMRLELGRLHRELRFTAVYVTHDLDEAMLLGDRIVVMRDGRIAQIGTPDEVHRRPQDRFVAELLGVTNYLPGVVSGVTDDTVAVECSLGRVRAPSPARPIQVGSNVVVCIRPSALNVAASDEVDGWPGHVVWSRSLGDEYVGIVRTGNMELDVRAASGGLPPSGTDVRISIATDHGVSVLLAE